MTTESNPLHRVPAPFTNSYWVVPGKLAAGEYPGAKEPQAARSKIRALQNAGVDWLIDLTEPGELLPYENLWAEEANAAGHKFTHRRMPIRDLGVPRDPKEMEAILDEIENAQTNGHTVYVHCWGGVVARERSSAAGSSGTVPRATGR